MTNSSDTPNSQYEVSTLIPQKPPFVLVDYLVQQDNEQYCIFTIPPDHVMVEKGHLMAGGLLENMAQTSAAIEGWNLKQKQEKVRNGYIVSVKDFKIARLPSIGTTLKTKTNIIDRIMDIAVISAEITNENEFVASCEMRVLLSE